MVGSSRIVVLIVVVVVVVAVVAAAAGFLTSLFAQLILTHPWCRHTQQPLGAEVAFQSTATKSRKPGKRHSLESFVQIFLESLNEEQKLIDS